MAAHLKETLGLETDLVKGSSGEFTVWLGDKKIAEKHGMRFPTPEEVAEAISSAR